ncbi:MAG TPA: hypothetical protein VNJ28_06965, partial [Candidatus Limnocylindrales bacterium]|nr:hypothetical protein [Candidatus Limnocylindrales bacterium]
RHSRGGCGGCIRSQDAYTPVMRALGAIQRIVTILLAGALAGYVVAALASAALAGSPLLGGSGESPEARAFVVAILTNPDPEAVAELRPRRGIVARARELLGRRAALSEWHAERLTFLGSGSQGRATVNLYVAEVRAADGRVVIIPFVVTIAGGEVVRVE